jgi:hypothetical protein
MSEMRGLQGCPLLTTKETPRFRAWRPAHVKRYPMVPERFCGKLEISARCSGLSGQEGR